MSIKTFFYRVFPREGDNFEGFFFDWAPMKELILTEIYEGVKKLGNFSILDVPDDAVSKVARRVAAAEKMGNKVGWLDKVIGDVYAKRDHFIMLQKDHGLSARLEEL